MSQPPENNLLTVEVYTEARRRSRLLVEKWWKDKKISYNFVDGDEREIANMMIDFLAWGIERRERPEDNP